MERTLCLRCGAKLEERRRKDRDASNVFGPRQHREHCADAEEECEASRKREGRGYAPDWSP